MKLLAIELEKKRIEETVKSQLLKQEAIAVLELKTRGVLREIYFDEAHCAVIVLECETKAVAEIYLEKLPLVAEGYIKFKITELKHYTGFYRLETGND